MNPVIATRLSSSPLTRGVRRQVFSPQFGATREGGAVRFRLWAPDADAVQVHVRPAAGGRVGGSRAAPTTSGEHVFDLAVLELHRALLRLRHERGALRGSDECETDAEAVNGDTLVMQRGGPDEQRVLIVARLRGYGPIEVAPLTGGPWRQLLSTEDDLFTADPMPALLDRAVGVIEFHRPGAIIFTRVHA